MPESTLPIVHVAPLRDQHDCRATANEIRRACTEMGFFYVTGHGVDLALQETLENLCRQFFAQDESVKRRIAMERGGRAWRGYFPVGDELTQGQPDQKEGLYFGTDLPDDDPRVRAGTPLHGANLIPELPGFRAALNAYLAALTELGHTLMRGIALSLELDADYFRRTLTYEPTILFRVFHYPPLPPAQAATSWGVGEHTDYGLLTLLRQDTHAGLQVRTPTGWIEAPPLANTFVCNLGDMLERMTGGLYCSTPHRVQNRSQHGRLSFPFFFDPAFDAEVQPVHPVQPVQPVLPPQESQPRWDGTDLQHLEGTYGDYLLRKVSRVFPDLHSQLDGDDEAQGDG